MAATAAAAATGGGGDLNSSVDSTGRPKQPRSLFKRRSSVDLHIHMNTNMNTNMNMHMNINMNMPPVSSRISVDNMKQGLALTGAATIERVEKISSKILQVRDFFYIVTIN